MPPVITSNRNKHVVAAARLKKRGLREQYQRFLVEGAQATAEGLAAGAVETVFHVDGSSGRVPEVVEQARKAGVTVLEVSESVMGHLTSAVTPQGLVATSRFVDTPVEELPAAGGVIPILCSVRDPGNAGTILRSADAAGAAGLVFSKDSVDVYNSKTVRASAGSVFHLPIVRDTDPNAVVAQLKERGAQVLAADARGDVTMYEADLTKPTALLLGNEAWGLRDETRALADATVRVPIEGKAESLNLAAAAALLLFESARQRGGGGGHDLAALLGASGHDLRLPLTAVKGFASTLVERWDRFEDHARRELVSGMLLDLDRIATMVTLLVEIGHLELGQKARTVERQDVRGVLDAVTHLFERSADYPDVIVSGRAEAQIEPSHLQAIVMSMCEGSLWWGSEGPIEIEARSEGDRALIEVRREGGGDEADPFADASEGPVVLQLALRVVESLGGSLTVKRDSRIAFRLSLPG